MTGFTPHFALPYPSGGDRPCDGAQQITALRDATYDQLDVFDGQLRRQLSPAKVSIAWSGAPQQVPGSARPFWNTVEQDDMGAADLIVRNDGFTLGREPEFHGMYLVGFITNIAIDLADLIQPGVEPHMWSMVFEPNPFNIMIADFELGWLWPGEPGADATQPPSFAGSGLLAVQAETFVALRRGSSIAGEFFGTDLQLVSGRLWAVRLGVV